MSQGKVYWNTSGNIKTMFYYSIYVVCACQRSFGAPIFINVTYPPILLISNADAGITTANVPRLLYLENQKWASFNKILEKAENNASHMV